MTSRGVRFQLADSERLSTRELEALATWQAGGRVLFYFAIAETRKFLSISPVHTIYITADRSDISELAAPNQDSEMR